MQRSLRKLLEAGRLRLNQPVDVRQQGGSIIMGPLPPRYDIDVLVAGITSKNRHDAVEAGRPAGQEVW